MHLTPPASCHNPSKVLKKGQVLSEFVKNKIFQHLTTVENEFRGYFSEFFDEDFVLNLFKLLGAKVPDTFQNKFMKLKSDS